jgi:hypothetical protein
MSSENFDSKVRDNGTEESIPEVPQHDSLRRQALNFSILGGIAAFIAACGKNVSRFDKPRFGGGDGTGGTPEPAPNPNPNPTSTPPPVSPPVDPDSGVPGPGLKPGSCLPVSVQIVDVSPKSGITVDAQLVSIYRIYDGRFSKLLAVKLGSGKAAVGDIVHLIGKTGKDDASGKILATRRVMSTDMSGTNAGLIFETLVLLGSAYIDVILVKGGVKTKQTIDVRPEMYRNKVANLPVVDLSYAITGDQPSGNLFTDFTFGGSTAPTMAGTSEPNKVSLGQQFGTDLAYMAADNSQKWNVSALVGNAHMDAGSALVENLFGEKIALGTVSASDLFIQSNSFAVYQKRTVGAKDYLVRYFFFVG